MTFATFKEEKIYKQESSCNSGHKYCFSQRADQQKQELAHEIWISQSQKCPMWGFLCFKYVILDIFCIQLRRLLRIDHDSF